MIVINFKYVLIAFLILAVSSCAAVLLAVNSDDDSSTIKLVTSIPKDSQTTITVTSKVRQTKTTKVKKTTITTKRQKVNKNSTTSHSTTKSKNTSLVTSVKFPLDINEVSKDELMLIDGVGDITANKILSYRKRIKYYTNLVQLKEVDGIGEATYLKLKKYLYVSKDKYKKINETSKTLTTKITSAAKKKATKYTYKAQLTEKKLMKTVNINTAEREELMSCLLIDEDEALEIIDLREKIGGQFANTLELLIILEDNEYNRIKDYITI